MVILKMVVEIEFRKELHLFIKDQYFAEGDETEDAFDAADKNQAKEHLKSESGCCW